MTFISSMNWLSANSDAVSSAGVQVQQWRRPTAWGVEGPHIWNDPSLPVVPIQWEYEWRDVPLVHEPLKDPTLNEEDPPWL